MLEKRFSIEACAAELEMARRMHSLLASSSVATEEEVRKAAIVAGKLAVKLAAARLAQAEYYLSSLVARADYLEARCSSAGAVKRERDELAWIRQALPSNSAIITRLAVEMEQRKRELEEIVRARSESTDHIQPKTRVAKNRANYQP